MSLHLFALRQTRDAICIIDNNTLLQTHKPTTGDEPNSLNLSSHCTREILGLFICQKDFIVTGHVKRIKPSFFFYSSISSIYMIQSDSNSPWSAKVFSSAELVRLLAIFSLTPWDFRLSSLWNRSWPWGRQWWTFVQCNHSHIIPQTVSILS